MKQIYVDEAGTSRTERVAVVAGVVVDGDKEFQRAEGRINDAIRDHIPAHMREGFVFHAKDIFGKHKKAEGWSFDKCNEITEAWLQIIVDLKLPLSVAWFEKQEEKRGRYTRASNALAHVCCFTVCLQKCDEFIADHTPDQVASVVAEDCPQMKRILRGFSRGLFQGALVSADVFSRRINHIKNAPHFADKEDAVLLQLADACAYSFRRYISRLPGGERLFAAMRGKPEWDIGRDHTLNPLGYFTFTWRPNERFARAHGEVQTPNPRLWETAAPGILEIFDKL